MLSNTCFDSKYTNKIRNKSSWPLIYECKASAIVTGITLLRSQEFSSSVPNRAIGINRLSMQAASVPEPSSIGALSLLGVGWIAAVALRDGVNIQTQTRVEAIKRSQTPLIVRTLEGEISTKFVIHATNAAARQLRPILKDLIVPVRGQVIITEPVASLWNFAWLANHGYE